MLIFSVSFPYLVYVLPEQVGRAVTRLSLEREVWGSNLEPVKSDTVFPTDRHQARRQDSVTGGGAEINFGGHEKFIYVNSREAQRHEKFINCTRCFKGIFRPKSGIQAVFPTENSWSQKKSLHPKKCHEIRCQSTKTTKIPVVNTNLGLDLHSSSPKPVNFFGAKSSLGGHKQSFGGAWPRYAPPWRRVWGTVLTWGAQFLFGGAQAVIWLGTAPVSPPWRRVWLPPLQNFFERSCVARAHWRKDGPRQLATRFGVIQRV